MEILHNQPLPPPASKYPWAEMGHGDALKVPCKADELTKVANRVRASAKRYVAGHRPGFEVELRRIMDSKDSHVMVWLIDPTQQADQENA